MVDDQPARLLAYESILSDLHIELVQAASADRALETLLAREFAVILLDVSLPGMDGFELAKLIRQHPLIARTPIIFITGLHISAIDQLKGYEVGAIDYISAPVVPEILRSKVAMLLELYQRRAELQELNEALGAARRRLASEHAAAIVAGDGGLSAVFSQREQLAVIETIPQLVWSARPDGFSDYYNRRFLDYLGMSLDEMQGHAWEETLHPDDRDRARAAWARACESGGQYSSEFRIRRARDGAYRWHVVRGEPLRSEDGRILRWFGTCTDVDDLKQAEQALNDSRERLVLAKKAAQLGTFDWDIQSDTLVWDERTHELWGIQPAGPITVATFFSQIHPDDHAETQRAIDRSLDPAGDHGYAAVYRVVHRIDRQTRWVEASGRVYVDSGRPVRMVGVVQEVTHRVLTQQKLAESEQRFRELANHIEQIVWSAEELGKVSWYNQRWYDYTGAPEGDLRDEVWMKAIDPDRLEQVMKGMQASIAAGTTWEDTFRLRSRTGEFRWFLARAVPIRDETGRVLRWFGTSTDITEQRQLQLALEQADRRKDEFLAMLAHELRNPVAPISNAAEALVRLLPDDRQAKPFAEMIQRQVAHLSRLLDDLLDVARITEGRIELKRETVTVDACLDPALEAAQPLIREKGHQVVRVQAFGPLYVSADKVRLAQCFANVLVNAAKYSPGGGEIRLRSGREGGHAVIEISDGGIGIAPVFLPRIFDLFAQSESSLDRAQGGLGIGLAVCKQLLEMQDGTIAVASEGIGRGTTVTIRLPLVQAPGTALPAEPRTAATRRRILIVDDNRDAADTLAMLLALDGHETRAAYSALEALDLAADYEPHTVLLDIGLPDIDGYEAARRIRSIAPQVRLFALSGYGQPDDKRRSAAAGFDGHLVKPVDLGSLNKALDKG